MEKPKCDYCGGELRQVDKQTYVCKVCDNDGEIIN